MCLLRGFSCHFTVLLYNGSFVSNSNLKRTTWICVRGRTSRGDLFIKDEVITNEIDGNHHADTRLNGQLLDTDAIWLLGSAARTKVARCRDGHANRPGTTYAFQTCDLSTSGRIHGEFLSLHCHTQRYFKQSEG